MPIGRGQLVRDKIVQGSLGLVHMFSDRGAVVIIEMFSGLTVSPSPPSYHLPPLYLVFLRRGGRVLRGGGLDSAGLSRIRDRFTWRLWVTIRRLSLFSSVF